MAACAGEASASRPTSRHTASEAALAASETRSLAGIRSHPACPGGRLPQDWGMVLPFSKPRPATRPPLRDDHEREARDGHRERTGVSIKGGDEPDALTGWRRFMRFRP